MLLQPLAEVVAGGSSARLSVQATLRDGPLRLTVRGGAGEGAAGDPLLGELRRLTVFVTAFDQYALRAFEARALDYLLKPLTETRFRTAFERARGLIGRPDAGERTALLALVEQVRSELRGLARGSADPPADRLLVREEGRFGSCPWSKWSASRRPATMCGCTPGDPATCCGRRSARWRRGWIRRGSPGFTSRSW